MWNDDFSTLTAAKVRAFCEKQFPESIVLDYKFELSNKEVAKHLCAFANSLGGLMIWGVHESEGRPEQDPKGIERPSDVAERLQSIANTQVFPPVHSEIRAVSDSESGLGFIVLRIHPNPERPHCVVTESGSHIYIRTGDQSRKYRLADVETIRDLLQNRQRSEDVIKGYQERARVRLGNAMNKCTGCGDLSMFPGSVELAIYPRFPLPEPLKMEAVGAFTEDPNWASPSRRPYLSQTSNRITAEGRLLGLPRSLAARLDRRALQFADLSCSGGHRFWRIYGKVVDGDRGSTFDLRAFLNDLTGFLIVSHNFCQEMGIRRQVVYAWGAFCLQRLHGITGEVVYMTASAPLSLDNSVGGQWFLWPEELLNATPRILKETADTLARCFGLETAGEEVDFALRNCNLNTG